MTFKVEPDKLSLLSKQLLSHLVRARGLQADLQREKEEINSVLYGSQFRPPFEGQIRANNENIETICRVIVEYLECQGAWLSYFARMAADADNAPLSLKQAETILEKYDERFILMTRTGGPKMLAEDPNYTDIPFTSPMGLQVQQEKRQEYDRAMMNTYKELLGINTFTRLTTGTEPLTGEKLSPWAYAGEAGLTALSIIPFGGLARVGAKGSKLAKVAEGTGKIGADNIAQFAKYKELLKAEEAANPVVDSLRQTGQLPSNYVTKTVAEQNGWKPGKALNNYAQGGQLGGDVFQNTTKVLPEAPGRVWYEADIGLSNTMSRSKQPGTRLLYSNDGQMYITTDHYETVNFIGTYK